MKGMVRVDGFVFDAHRLVWSFQAAGLKSMVLHNASSAIEVNGRRFRPSDASSARLTDKGIRKTTCGVTRLLSLELEFSSPSFAWTIDYAVDPHSKRVVIDSSLKNLSSSTIMLGSWDIIDLDRKRGGDFDIGPEPDHCRFFKMYLWDTRVNAINSCEGKHSSEYIGHIFNPTAKEVFYAGFVTVDRMVCEHVVQYTAGRVQLYRASCALLKHELPAGQEIRSETLWLAHDHDPYRPLESWAMHLQKVYKPRLNPKTTVGWIGWSWRDALSEGEESAEKIVRDNAVAIRTRLKGFDIDYIWVSQVNLKNMIPGNWMDFNRQHFPGGFEKLTREVEKMNFKMGLWVAPFWLFGQAIPLEENKPNLVRRKDGSILSFPTTWEFIQSEKQGRDKFDIHYLDGSHPGTLAFLRKVFSFYRKLGIRYYMLDFLGCKTDERTVWDKKCTWAEADRRIMAEIRKSAGPDTHLLSAVASTPLYTGCVDAARVNTDYGEGRPLYPPFHCLYNSTYIVNDKYFGNAKVFLQNAASSYFTHRRLYINDLNLMTIDKPVPRSIAEITATVFGLSGSPIMLGDDIGRIDDERLSMIKKCLPRSSDTAFPLDLFENVLPENYSRQLLLRVSTKWEDYLLLGVFNLDDKTYSAEFTAGKLGLKKRSSYRLFDFWDESYGGTFKDSFVCEVPPRSCRLLRIAQAKPHPWLLSTNMHVRQGQVEVNDVRWDAASMTLSGSCSRPKGQTGSIYFLMPDGWRLVNNENHWLMKDGRDMSVVIKRNFMFKKPVERFSLKFAKLQYTTVY